MTIFNLPDLGEGLPNAEVQKWHVKEGEQVKVDQLLVSMETAKAVVDVPSPFNGRIVKLYGQPGDIIETGFPLVEFEGAESAGKTNASEEQKPASTPESKSTAPASIKASPAVRALANKLGVDLNKVKATGPNGTISSDDVNRAANKEAPQALSEVLHGARRTMAIIMAKSHAEVAPVSLTEDADIHAWPEKTDVTLRLIRAIVKACQAEPALNAHFDGNTISRELFKEINLGIALDTPIGLFVPVIKDVAQQKPETLRAAINEFKNKGKTQAFSPQDLQNPTISLSNFGTIAGRFATPIIVPPMVAIIGVGKTRMSVVPFDGKPVIHPLMPICITVDHRAVTGGEAARFLATLLNDLQTAS